jgi:hypothetical protein
MFFTWAAFTNDNASIPPGTGQSGTAKQASMAIRNDLYNRACSVVEIDFQLYFTSLPHRKLMILITKRIPEGGDQWTQEPSSGAGVLDA